MTSCPWRNGNQVRLLENGEEFFPRVFGAIARARREVLVETFILFDDRVGEELRRTLIAAARRGVRVDLTVDGYGSEGLSATLAGSLKGAGVRIHVFDPRPRVFGVRTNLLRRFHRKFAVIDGERAFVGGINFAWDQLRESGPEGKQDYAVEVRGPVVDDIHAAARITAGLSPRVRGMREPRGNGEGVRARLVLRDSAADRAGIEPHYRAAIRGARREIILASAYFFPGIGLLRDLASAARRGVSVHLVMQGNPDRPEVNWVSSILYDDLLRAGVQIHEYLERPLHAKVAVIDEEWATVGSSNLDPLSLFLNVEADLLIHDGAFASGLRRRLMLLIWGHSRLLERDLLPRAGPWRRFLRMVAYYTARRIPVWAGRLRVGGARAPQIVHHGGRGKRDAA